MPTIIFIADASTPNGKALEQRLAELRGVDLLMGNDVGVFQGWALLAEVDVIAVVAFAGGDAALLSELWPLCPKVRWVHSLAAGVETLVPQLVALPRGPETPLTNAKGAFSRSLAEYSLAAMLHFNKQVPRLQANRAGKVWEKFIMNELHGQTVGFVGFGDIAQATARLCKALGMRVVALRNSRGLDDAGLADAVYYTCDGQKLDVFREADHVICSLPGGADTLKFCGCEEFAAMKPSGVFISIGRGTCVDEGALAAALLGGHVAAAALDVFAVEPLPPESPLWSLENVLLSSHNADLTADYIGATWSVFLERLAEYQAPGWAGFAAEVDKAKGY